MARPSTYRHLQNLAGQGGIQEEGSGDEARGLGVGGVSVCGAKIGAR